MILHIRKTLERRLNGWATGKSIAIAWQNVSFKPVPNQTWLQVTLMPAQTVSGSLVTQEHKGILHINVFVALNQGSGEAESIASELAALFPAGLVVDGVAIPSPPTILQGRPDPDYYQVPVQIRYRMS
ncbi:phage tail terminator-like protein [Alcaligenes endophyticus]|uniref:DUF4128 domain-containing protein n=1 Tax=Alcaligenes endophyticus TaxID=1929088 RepID=A0ABT8EIY6_9BURK|nr:phage tail terminator-like protein [Alcaligenes endophyticus]MCX5592532.1 phage tail terminator-like protein [Alcaligenes endophyticus]MDN4121258.1 DUF4128 domain-containing protein [Alcaligenes endophyticus]